MRPPPGTIETSMPRLLLALALGAATSVAAQAPPADSAAVHDAERVPDARATLRAAGVLALATAATMPFDARLAAAVRGEGPQRSIVLRRGARVANVAGDPGVVVGSALLWGVGRLARESTLAAHGLHAGDAIVLGGVATSALKLLAGRQRPYVETGDADDFAIAHGTHGGRESFPSGHTTAAFAFASAIASDLRGAHPRAARVAAPLLYAGAASVGLSRMYDDRHWASDVVLGAGIGALAGARVAAYARAHPANWVDRHLGALTILPGMHGRGATLGVHRTTR